MHCILFVTIDLVTKIISLPYKKPSKQEAVRTRIVNFYDKYRDAGKKFTVNHFVLEGVPKRTVYNILKCTRVIESLVQAKNHKL